MKFISKSHLSTYLILSSLFIMLFSSSCYKTFKERAKSQINQVKSDGCIFVRLRTSQNKINKLREFGYHKDADLEVEKIVKENKDLVDAFNRHWDFSKFYFFSSGESVKIKNGKFNEVGFLGKNMEVDTSIKCDCSDGLVVDLSRTTSNLEEGSNNSGVVLQGLVVRDRSFKQLNYPFPYLSRKYFIIFRRSISTMVKDLNSSFYTYFKVANK
ncbi:MAG: hypothetical protein ACI85O_001745 [Saprospiraceae bacterium]|jgi:hypothetical protein